MPDSVKNNIAPDWQKNWGGSIAIKITAPILWALIFVGMVIAVIAQYNWAQEIDSELSKRANQIAYEVSDYLSQRGSNELTDVQAMLTDFLAGSEFHAAEIQIFGNNLTLGVSNEKDKWLRRTIPYVALADDGPAQAITLKLAHTPVENLVSAQRKQLLVNIGIPFFLFGLALAWLIRRVVTKPIFDLVTATKAVSEGDMTQRLHSTRQDEFGYLAQFFNQMLDTLQEKQNKLEQSVLAAETANQAKSQFLANMSHEIRTPLTAIIGYTDLLRDEESNTPSCLKQIDSIFRAGKHLQEIINDILDLSKIEAGQLVIENISMHPIEVVEAVNEVTGFRAKEQGLDFAIDYKFPLPDTIVSDPTRLKQILLNLCSNAVKFTRQGSVRVVVECLVDQALMKFSVVDQGIGMTEEEMSKIFKPFSQADSSTTREFGGTGLGLCISQQLANKLGGEVSCSSQKGIGSKFSVTIATGDISNSPMLQQLVPEGRLARSCSTNQLQLSGRILLAEDIPDNQQLVAMYVRRTGASITIVENGKLAVEKALNEDFDLILMDMQMPVMGGEEATKRLRASGYSKPIVALTANALKSDRQRCEAAGTDDFLTKPLDMTRFYAVLQRYLQVKQDSRDDSNVYIDPGLLHDPEYKALVNKFVQSFPDKQRVISMAFQLGDWESLRTEVHKLKGSGAGYGHPLISELSGQIQSAIEQKNFAVIPPKVESLLDYFTQVLDEHNGPLFNVG